MSKDASPGNVLLITTDQHRADTLGAYGNPVCQTPNLDRFATQGTRFDAARTTNPFCQPVRATILTGQYPSSHGVTFNGIDLPADAADRAVSTELARAGAKTAFFGKAHFGSTFPFYPTGHLESVAGSALMPEDWTGPYYGFEHVELVLFGHSLRAAPLMGDFTWCWGPPPMGLHYGRWLFRDGPKRGTERLRLMQPEAAGESWGPTQTWRNQLPEEDHPTTWVTDRAITWLEETTRADDNFFAWISFPDPHHPMDPPSPWCDLYDPADVAQMLPEPHPEEFDTKPPLHKMWTLGNRGTPFEWANPGGATLSDRDLATMVAAYYGMVSQLDHNIGRILDRLDTLGLAGETTVIITTDHGEMLGDHQMVFKGPVHYDGLLRIPLLARGPGIDPGTVVTTPVGSVDLAPTILEAAGVPDPEHYEGRSIFGEAQSQHLCEDDFDAVVRVPLRTLTTEGHKLTRWLDAPGVGELYDLVEDPGEITNRWSDPAYAAVRDDLLAELNTASRPVTRHLDKVGLVG